MRAATNDADRGAKAFVDAKPTRITTRQERILDVFMMVSMTNGFVTQEGLSFTDTGRRVNGGKSHLFLVISLTSLHHSQEQKDPDAPSPGSAIEPGSVRGCMCGARVVMSSLWEGVNATRHCSSESIVLWNCSSSLKV